MEAAAVAAQAAAAAVVAAGEHDDDTTVERCRRETCVVVVNNPLSPATKATATAVVLQRARLMPMLTTADLVDHMLLCCICASKSLENK
jgi:hypothetical protein